MNQKPIIVYGLLVLIIGSLLSGCNQGGDKTSAESRKSMIQSVNPEATAVKKNEHDVAEKVKKDVQSVPAIYDVAVIKGEEEILVAYKVKHMQRYHMKKIEEEINKKLEKNYPKENFVVSSDFKIFIEAIELKDRMKDKDYSTKDAEERLKKIIKFKKERT
ncbi:YhcN/YlaJ family sporulation lipoprotein [Mesobacillus maritimus]|uniref:YhcN/YlaJ family sporulation lipoprotein n=1 Tax=Mesobacillus maritimus TaxID=1643336 RepID=UPI00384FB607